jgi:putative ABC transport system permease protein
MKLFPLVIRNLLRNRRRTILSVLSIGVSIFIFAALMSLPAVVAEILRDRVNALRLLVTNKAGIGYPLPAAYGAKIRAAAHVDALSGYLVELASYRGPKEMVAVAGVDPQAIPLIWPDWGTSVGAVDELVRARSSGVVSEDLMKRFKWKVGDKVTLHGITTPVELSFTIVGTVGERGPQSAVLVPLERLNQLEGNAGLVVLFFVKLDRSEFATTLIRDIAGAGRTRDGDAGGRARMCDRIRCA